MPHQLKGHGKVLLIVVPNLALARIMVCSHQSKTTTRQMLNLCIPMMPFTPDLSCRCLALVWKHHKFDVHGFHGRCCNTPAYTLTFFQHKKAHVNGQESVIFGLSPPPHARLVSLTGGLPCPIFSNILVDSNSVLTCSPAKCHAEFFFFLCVIYLCMNMKLIESSTCNSMEYQHVHLSKNLILVKYPFYLCIFSYFPSQLFPMHMDCLHKHAIY